MTIPALPIPDVKPLYFSRTPSLGESLAPSLQLLLKAIEMRQQREEVERQHDIANQAGQGATGVIGSLFPSVPSPGNAALSALGMPVQPFAPVAEHPVAAAFRNIRPGEATMEVLKQTSGLLAQRLASDERRKLAKAPVAPKLELQSDSEGFGKIVNLGDQKAFQVYNEDGSRFRMKDPKADAPPGTTYNNMLVMDPASPFYGKVVRKPMVPGQVSDPSKEYPVENIKQGNWDAARFYPTMLEAYKSARNSKIAPEDAGKFSETGDLMTKVGSLAELSPDKTATMAMFANVTLKPQSRKWLSAILSLANSRRYALSGKAVTQAEFYQILAAEVPLPLDEPVIQDDKWLRLEASIGQVANEAQAALLMQGHRPENFKTVHATMAKQRREQQAIAALNTAVRAEHPNWTPQQIANEALRRYRAAQPALQVAPDGNQ